jgi:hypothetical protein
MKTTADIEEPLRTAVKTVATARPGTKLTEPDQGLEDSVPFFAALEEIRNTGRQPVPIVPFNGKGS